MHRCIAIQVCHAIRIEIQFARIRDTRYLATFLRFLFERHTNITACSSSQRQPAKKYQLMLNVMSLATNGVMTCQCTYLPVDTDRDGILVIVFLACDFRGPGTNLIGP